MRCDNCGAAMELVRGRDYFVCEYCHAFHFPDAEGRDAVRVMGQLHATRCPLCSEHLVEASVEKSRVLYCDNCRGILVHRPAFNGILRRFRSNDPPERSPIDPSELQRSIDCPRCARRMQTHPYLGPGHVVIDTCSHCALMWLDHGELHTIVCSEAEARARRRRPF